VDRLAGGLVLIGLEVSVIDVRSVVMMMKEDGRQTWRCGRRVQSLVTSRGPLADWGVIFSSI
jgi:hypothetical protein